MVRIHFRCRQQTVLVLAGSTSDVVAFYFLSLHLCKRGLEIKSEIRKSNNYYNVFIESPRNLEIKEIEDYCWMSIGEVKFLQGTYWYVGTDRFFIQKKRTNYKTKKHVR
jgi:hypothetical protein